MCVFKIFLLIAKCVFGLICCRRKRNESDAVNVSGVRKRIIVVIVHRAETIKVIRYVSNDAVKN